jgi:7-carboxy-7-deazaguanine synthase
MADNDSIVVNEIFHSIQGESSFAGAPCVFVRLTGCPLRCAWCDTPYAFTEGRRRAVDDVVRDVLAYNCPLAEVTGGEPLVQEGAFPLIRKLLDAGRAVLVETCGAVDVSSVDPRAVTVMDLKAPSSGEEARNRWENLDLLRPHDEVKIVLADRGDYEWARAALARHRLAERFKVHLSPAHGRLSPADLARWALEDGLRVRVSLQLHRFIWPGVERGV